MRRLIHLRRLKVKLIGFGVKKMNEAVKDSEWYRQKFLYPNGTLKNKLNITDAAELAQKEYLSSGIRAVAVLRKNKKITSVEDLEKIHSIMCDLCFVWTG